MASKNKIFRNFIALVSGEALSRLIAFGATIYLARVFGADGYGIVVFAIAINLYVMKIAEFAIEWSGTDEIAKNPDGISELASAVLSARLLMTSVLFIIASGLAWVLLPEPERSMLLLYLLVLFPVSLNTKWVHVGIEDARPVGLSRVLGETLSLLIILALVHGKGDMWVAPIAQVCSETFISLMLIQVLRKRSYKFGLQWHFKAAIPIFRKSLPILGHMLLGLFIYNSDMIFLRIFHDSASVGLYSVSYTLISFIANLGLAYGMSMMPAFAKAENGSIEESTLFHNSLAQVFAVSLPIAIGGFMMANGVINLAFGSEYMASILVLQLLVWSIPANLIRLAPWGALIARNQQHYLFLAILYAAIANIILNILLIPEYGIVGAAIATIITETLTSAIMFFYASRIGLRFVPIRRFMSALISGIVMALILYLLSSANLVVSIIAGGTSYLVILFLTGGITLQKGSLPRLTV